MITMEEHSTNGGLEGLMAKVLAGAGIGAILERLGIPDKECTATTGRGWLRQYRGFNAAVIVALARELL